MRTHALLQAKDRADAKERAAAEAAEHAARAAASRAAASTRTPVAVVMSDKQRLAVEGLMGELAAGEGGRGPHGLNSEEDGAERAALVDRLVAGGFSHADASAALGAVGVGAAREASVAAVAATAAAAAAGRAGTRVVRSHGGLQPYLDWLCLTLPVERLPARYRPGAEALRRALGSGSTAHATAVSRSP